MKVNRISDVEAYDPPKHFGCAALRLQGWDASDSRNFWVGLSHLLPGGGAEMDASPVEKVYVVVSGAVTVVTESGEATLGPLDSCHLAAGEARSVINRTNETATMIVVLEYPPGTER